MLSADGDLWAWPPPMQGAGQKERHVFPEDERRTGALVKRSSGRAEPQLDGLSQFWEMGHGTEENYTGVAAR